MTQTRAKWLLANQSYGSFLYAFVEKCQCEGYTTHPQGITREEDTFVREVWNQKPRVSTYCSAVCKIAKGKA